jgi:quercetin dioxygenase-like cupin family protein
MKRSSIATLLAACTVAAFAPASSTAQERIAPGSKVLWPAAELPWEAMPGLEGARQARLWGDPTKGEHGILYRWPAGTQVPVHTHTFSDRGVIVSGTLTLAVEGAAVKEFPPGSYFSLAGGTKHATGCKKGSDCTFFILREGRFDVNMAAAPK